MRYIRLRARPQLPAASFSEDLDDVAKPFCSLKPVHLEACLDPVRIAGLDCPNDLLVFGNREVKILDDGTGIQPPIAFRLRFDGFVERRHAGSGAVLDDEPVERTIILKDLAWIAIAV